ncbi:hypothetical protein HK096_010820, partial [Nowakowskiella sp. JEL0078]
MPQLLRHQIALFGATGASGLQFLKQAHKLNYEVHVFVRSKLKLLDILPEYDYHTLDSNQRIFEGDILNLFQLNAFFFESEKQTGRKFDNVVLTIGNTKMFGTDDEMKICSIGTENIMKALKDRFYSKSNDGVRILAVSSMGVGDSKFHSRLSLRIMSRLFLSQLLADKEIQENLIRNSGFPFVIIRPGKLTNGPKTGRYLVSQILTGGWVSREDLAHFLISCLDDSRFLFQATSIAYDGG